MPTPARGAAGTSGVGQRQRPWPGAARQLRSQTWRGDRGHRNPMAETAMRTNFKAMPTLPNSAVQVRPTSLIQSPRHQLARDTLGATKERLGKKIREGQNEFVEQRAGLRTEHRMWFFACSNEVRAIHGMTLLRQTILRTTPRQSTHQDATSDTRISS